jgi:hypothetical protein
MRGFRRRRDAWGIATTLAAEAASALDRRDATTALDLATRAAAAKSACGDALGHGYALQLQAKAHYLAADYASAFTTLRRALDLH